MAVSLSSVSFLVIFFSGHSGCDGQSAVYAGGDSVENLLEVQPKSGWRCHHDCVSYLFL